MSMSSRTLAAKFSCGGCLTRVLARLVLVLLVQPLGNFAVGPASAAPLQAPLQAPTGRIILRLSGNIERRNDGDDASFDLTMLEALPQTTVRTISPWTDGESEFVGPLVRVVLERVGARGHSVQARAINDYQVDIPLSDFDEYDVILALARDGRRLRVRDRGPLWIVYPWSERPELRDELHHGRSIWHLKALTVE
jgi:hypothetical protein